MNQEYISSQAYLTMLSNRIRQYRLDYPMTQKEFADRSGVSLRAIQGFENGKDIRLQNLCKLLKALDLSDNLLLLVPDVTQRPSALLPSKQEKQRVRARKTATEEERMPFRWGDEE